MRGCSAGPVEQVLVGLNRVGVYGLREAIQTVRAADLPGREEVVDFLLAAVSEHNYIANPRDDNYRAMLWREYCRFRGDDIRELYSEIAVTVRGEPGEERDRFVATLRSVFGEFELKPVVRYAAASSHGKNPQLVIGGETIIAGFIPRKALMVRIRKHVTHW
jgi:hypothetical protein